MNDQSTAVAKAEKSSQMLFAYFWRPTKWKMILVAAILVAGISATAARAYKWHQVPQHGEFDRSKQGYCDFHQGAYFPAKAFLNRISPYGPEFVDHYPVPRPMPLFTPSVLVLHAPIGLVSEKPMEVTFFLFSTLLMMLIAFLAVRYSGMAFSWYAVMLVGAVMVFSRAGHSTLFTGYFTFEIVIGVLLALQFGRSKPWLGGVGLFLAATKPTFAIPLALIMIFRGHFRAAIIGTVVSVIAAGLAAGWLLSETSASDLMDGIKTSQELHEADPNEMPENTWVRVDTLAVIAKWKQWNPSGLVHLLVMVPILLISAPLLWKLDKRCDDHAAMGVAGLLSCICLLASIYHQFYDALILVAPAVGLIAGSATWKKVPTWLRYVILLLVMVPAWNYLSAEIFLNRFVHSEMHHRVITSISPVCLLLAYVLVLGVALMSIRGRVAPNGSNGS